MEGLFEVLGRAFQPSRGECEHENAEKLDDNGYYRPSETDDMSQDYVPATHILMECPDCGDKWIEDL
jgi:hypothetical protein